MSQLLHNLTIVDEATGKQFTIKQIPGDKTAIQLLSSIAGKLNLPSGATGTLFHKITEKEFRPHETLSEAGIEDGDVLVVKFELNESGFGQALISQDFAKNPEPRCPCVLLLDVSSSMAGDSIKELNKGLVTLQEALVNDSVASLRVEIGIITFGSDVRMIQDFITVNDFRPPKLSASGTTPMGRAINLALDKLEERKRVYKANGIGYYRPWIFMITDGEPNDEWQSAAKRVKKLEKEKKVAFFAVGVENANMERLAEIAVRQPLKLQENKWQTMFEWLSNSLSSKSRSNIDEDEIPLQSPFGWATA
ncbi:MAG: VWA domain-containing protein [Calditrichaeota bacterium]|nr:MAG: VWA domain-containing protein [Calditrichota bacterium]